MRIHRLGKSSDINRQAKVLICGTAHVQHVARNLCEAAKVEVGQLHRHVAEEWFEDGCRQLRAAEEKADKRNELEL